MAKNIGVVQYSGTLGNTVGAKKSAGQKANTIRIKPVSTKVSYTGAVLEQRMKVRGASNFYTALSGILDHSFQNVAYGAPSHNYFLANALKRADTEHISGSQIMGIKGSNVPLPFALRIAEGTAPVVDFSVSAELKGVIKVDAQATVAESNLYDALSALYAINAGDQLTLIACLTNLVDDGTDNFLENLPYSQVSYDIRRIIIDDNTLIKDLDEFADLSPAIDQGKLLLNYGKTVVAFAVIVSRPQYNANETDVKWLRSNCRMALADKWVDVIEGGTFYDYCLNSFKKTTVSGESPWYLNQGKA